MSSNIDPTTPKTGARLYALDIRIFKQTVKTEIEALQNTINELTGIDLTNYATQDNLLSAVIGLKDGVSTSFDTLKKIYDNFSNYTTTAALTALLAGKLNASDYNQHFKGKHTTLAALQTAYPTANAGDYGQVDVGAGGNVVNYNWDDEAGWVIGSAGSGATNTDQLPEGSSNLYFTSARAIAALVSTLTDYVTNSVLTNALTGKQETLVSGSNIKTINNTSILGSGDLTISAGGGDGNNTATDTLASSEHTLIFAQTSENILLTQGSITISSFGFQGLTPGQKKFVRVADSVANLFLSETAYLQTGVGQFGGRRLFGGDSFVVYVESSSLCKVVMYSSNTYIRTLTDIALGTFNVGYEMYGGSTQLGVDTTAGSNSVSIGNGAFDGLQGEAVAVGNNARAGKKAIAIGAYAEVNRVGEINFGRDISKKLGMGFMSWFSDGAVTAQKALDGASYFSLKPNTVALLDIDVVAVKSGVTGAAWNIKVAAKRGGTFASSEIMGTPVVTVYANDNTGVFANPENYMISTNTSDGSLRLTLQGGVGIKMHASARITEVTV